ncbi:hypothetical protein EDE04_6397 [Streptomyces sp. 2132.2]|uniref:hypothetical protein n=1 Tax=Streptomyces sp. 2132.2 TaxID=2485161 RepID=UPI000F955CE2|nr:hypothetical protein [Streptomyces sp. 2132.2]ROQ99839.1 hypothetical protein EDE04_6397 [Streptomyces sp. 2132.2]
MSDDAMRRNGEFDDRAGGEERPGDSGLSTQDLADPGRGRDAAVYPGDATADMTAAGDEDRSARGDGEGDGRAAERDALDEDRDQSLLDTKEAEEYRTTWREIQGRFVDDPQEAVRSADTLVAEVMQTLARSFADHKQTLVDQWGRGEEVATEDLRLALQRYRSFFNRLLKT